MPARLTHRVFQQNRLKPDLGCGAASATSRYAVEARTAQTCRLTRVPDAAVRPAIADIHASCSILAGITNRASRCPLVVEAQSNTIKASALCVKTLKVFVRVPIGSVLRENQHPLLRARPPETIPQDWPASRLYQDLAPAYRVGAIADQSGDDARQGFGPDAQQIGKVDA